MTGGDFNGDGNMDLAITNRESNNVTILLGDGQGGFIEAPGSPLNTPDPYDLVLTDFDGNGTLDLIVTNQSIGSISFFKEMAQGGFSLVSSLTVGSKVKGIAAADFNGDGLLDLAICDEANNQIVIFIGNGLGDFIRMIRSKRGYNRKKLSPLILTMTEKSIWSF